MTDQSKTCYSPSLQWGAIQCSCQSQNRHECIERRYVEIRAEWIASLPTNRDRKAQLEIMAVQSSRMAEMVRTRAKELLAAPGQRDLGLAA